jgi:hypothetical protein
MSSCMAVWLLLVSDVLCCTMPTIRASRSELPCLLNLLQVEVFMQEVHPVQSPHRTAVQLGGAQSLSGHMQALQVVCAI